MRNHVGVHLPSRTMRVGPLTDKDKEDLAFGLSQGVEYIALSFVRRADDLRPRPRSPASGAADAHRGQIETPDAVENLRASSPPRTA